MSTFYNDARLAPRPNQPRTPSVLALIEDDEGRLLLEHRSDAPEWSLIGGKMEYDETFAEALQREIREETGLEVVAYEFFGTFSNPGRTVKYADGNVYQLASLAYTVSVADISTLRLSEEATELRFFARTELPPEPFTATSAPILERYLSGERPPFLE